MTVVVQLLILYGIFLPPAFFASVLPVTHFFCHELNCKLGSTSDVLFFIVICFISLHQNKADVKINSEK